MLFLLALSVLSCVALLWRFLQLYAPTNLLERRVHAMEPRPRTGLALLVVATILLVAMHVVAKAVAAGAPGWLNVLVLVLAWDAIKVAWLTLASFLDVIRLGMWRLHWRTPAGARERP